MKDFRVVCATPAGRRRYMRHLVPQVLASPAIERYDLWVNTTDPGDVAFLEELGRRCPQVRLVPQPEGRVCGNASINAFFRQTTDADTIYVRVDDDLLWMEPGFIEKIVSFRRTHPNYFLVSPLVVNNALCTHILQACGKLRYPEYLPACSSGETAWKDGRFAEKVHRWFLRKLADGTWDKLRCGPKPISLNRFSINAICWFGGAFRAFGGNVTGDDEEFLSVTRPNEAGLCNCFDGSTIVSHFAFHPQRDHLDRTDVLEQYGKAVLRTYEADAAFARAREEVEAALAHANSVAAGITPPSGRIRALRRLIGRIRVPLVRFAPLRELRSGPPSRDSKNWAVT